MVYDPDDPPPVENYFDYWWGTFNRMAEEVARWCRVFGFDPASLIK